MHGSDKTTLLEEAQKLGPEDRAVLIVIKDADADEFVVNVEDHRGGGWVEILGIISAGNAFAQAEMNLRNTSDEEVTA